MCEVRAVRSVWCHFWFFFFKQKTAYEMRISDWSSDCAASASASLATASLKGGRAPRAPRLLFVRVGRFHSGEQRTGERVQIERIGPGGRDQLAELLDLAGLQSLGLVVQRPQFRVIVAHLSHLLSLAPMNGAAA